MQEPSSNRNHGKPFAILSKKNNMQEQLHCDIKSTFDAHSCNTGKYIGEIPARWSSFMAFSPVQLMITKG